MTTKIKKRIALIAILYPVPLFFLSSLAVTYFQSFIPQIEQGEIGGILQILIGLGIITFFILGWVGIVGMFVALPIGLAAYIWLGIKDRSKVLVQSAKKKAESKPLLERTKAILISIPSGFLGIGALTNALGLLFEGTYTSTILISGLLAIVFFCGPWIYAYRKTRNIYAVLQLIGYQFIVSIISWFLFYK